MYTSINIDISVLILDNCDVMNYIDNIEVNITNCATVILLVTVFDIFNLFSNWIIRQMLNLIGAKGHTRLLQIKREKLVLIYEKNSYNYVDQFPTVAKIER